MMTHDEMIAVIQAHKEGKQIQFSTKRAHPEWADCVLPPSWSFYECNYRIKPTPKLRKWRTEEVPLGCQVRHKQVEPKTRVRWILVGCDEDVIGVSGSGCRHTYDYALENWEHSIDNGKTWLPCGVEEA